MKTLEDRDLVRLAVSGETWAFGQLVERYGGRIYGRIRRVVRQPDEAQDLVQEIFLQAYRRLGQLRDGRRFSGWLLKIADNAAFRWRQRRMVQIRFEQLLTTEWGEHAVDESEAEREARMMVRQAIRQLSDAHRDVIEHHYFKGHSYEKTASQLGLKLNTVRSRLQKARQRIRKEMNEMKAIGQTYDLTAQDLQALYWATRFVSRDESRGKLQGVCLDKGGRVVACDGVRLLLRTLEGAEDVASQVILGPGFELEAALAERATLSIRGEEAILCVEGDDERVISIIDEPYVNYEAVIPEAEGIRVRLAAGELLRAVNLIAEHLESRHPGSETWDYQPRVEIQISSAPGALSLSTSRDMGYKVREEKTGRMVSNDDAPWDGVPYWRFTTSVEGQVNLEDSPEPFRIHVNHAYLSDVVSGIEAEGILQIFFTDPLKALLFVPAAHPDRKSLLMPLRME